MAPPRASMHERTRHDPLFGPHAGHRTTLHIRIPHHRLAIHTLGFAVRSMSAHTVWLIRRTPTERQPRASEAPAAVASDTAVSADSGGENDGDGGSGGSGGSEGEDEGEGEGEARAVARAATATGRRRRLDGDGGGDLAAVKRGAESVEVSSGGLEEVSTLKRTGQVVGGNVRGRTYFLSTVLDRGPEV